MKPVRLFPRVMHGHAHALPCEAVHIVVLEDRPDSSVVDESDYSERLGLHGDKLVDTPVAEILQLDESVKLVRIFRTLRSVSVEGLCDLRESVLRLENCLKKSVDFFVNLPRPEQKLFSVYSSSPTLSIVFPMRTVCAPAFSPAAPSGVRRRN